MALKVLARRDEGYGLFSKIALQAWRGSLDLTFFFFFEKQVSHFIQINRTEKHQSSLVVVLLTTHLYQQLKLLF